MLCGIGFRQFDKRGPPMKTTISRSALLTCALVVGLAVGGCSGMSTRDQNTAVGAGVGAVGGAILTGGSAVGTVGGAAVGGVIGNQVGKDKK
jgi:osmotically inducible lipoprotein OsmB